MKYSENKIYSVYPRVYCSGSIYVNDVPVVEWYGDETKDGGLGGDTVINNVLFESGEYEIKGRMFPRYGKKNVSEDDAMSIEFFLADKDNWKATRKQFHPKIESPWDGLSENINYPYYEISTKIKVELPYVLEGWQNSVDLSKMDKSILKKEVIEYYRKIHAILKEHNASKFLEMSKEKMKLQEQAFYFDEARKKDFLNGALELFNQNLEVEHLNESELDLEIMGYGKLVRLIKKDKTQPLQFKSPNLKEQSNIELDVKLHMKSTASGFSII